MYANSSFDHAPAAPSNAMVVRWTTPVIQFCRAAAETTRTMMMPQAETTGR